mmetsp:Transcript_88193/g.274104  ORF Transcript_88193/g.274104 Transcript_88193/m.274104 type:complete len:189 (-) Transcript_88193:145-711(-)
MAKRSAAALDATATANDVSGKKPMTAVPSYFSITVKDGACAHVVRAVSVESTVRSVIDEVKRQGATEVDSKRLVFNGYRLNSAELVGDVGIGPDSMLLLEHPAQCARPGTRDVISTDQVISGGIGPGNFYGDGRSVVLRMSSAPTEKMRQRQEEAEFRVHTSQDAPDARRPTRPRVGQARPQGPAKCP